MKKSLADMKPADGKEAPKERSFGAFKTVEGNQATIDLEKLREHNIFFATPCYGGMLTDQFFLSMFRASQTLMRHGINFRVTTLRNESLVTRARNILTAMFLESDCSHLLFIDSDIEFDSDSILRALAYDKPIMAAAYPKKALPIQYAINFKFQDIDTKQVRVENGAVEVLDASTGFFLIKREVLEKMIQAYPELHYRNDSNIDEKYNKYCYALFDTWLDPDDNRYLSEDYTFCRRWQKIGGEIWLDPNTKLNHVGSYTFEGDVGKIIGNN
jgi:GT2 family glycosyltransferase|tara:strand:+ start:834 stop:1646 length:813 start_codon:yes stop_codon:yes gene_type:complete